MDTDLNIEHWHAELNRALHEWDSDLSPSELHGALCGLVACGAINTAQQVGPKASVIIGHSVSSHSLLLTTLWELIWNQLDSESFELVPLVEENHPNQRLEQLAHWVQGFLMGVGYSEADLHSSPETQQALQDMIAISQVALDTDETIDVADLEEVFEYARMTVHLVFMETRQGAPEKVAASALQ